MSHESQKCTSVSHVQLLDQCFTPRHVQSRGRSRPRNRSRLPSVRVREREPPRLSKQAVEK